jgi:hypothetical protein
MDIEKRDFLEDLVYMGFEPRDEAPKPSDEERTFRRYTQDSPVMPDVWIHYGLEPYRRHQLLLTPMLDRAPGKLVKLLKKRLQENQGSAYHAEFEEKLEERGLDFGTPKIAYNQTTVVADLWFHELVRVALSLTPWWEKALASEEDPEKHPTDLLRHPEERAKLNLDLREALRDPSYDAQRGYATANLAWLTRVAGTIALAADLAHYRAPGEPQRITWEDLEARTRNRDELVEATFELLDVPESAEPLAADLFSINRNRQSMVSMYRSTPTVKADAVQQLFDVKGFNINWAILDSGIDATHWAFRARNADGKAKETAFERKETKRGVRWENNTRVLRTYDFTRIRELMSDDPGAKWKSGLSDEARGELERSLDTGRMIDWELLEPALRIEHDGDYEKYIPESHHGTHVAGILAADWHGDDDNDDVLPFSSERDERPQSRTGVCPEISLYDLRVVGDSDGVGDEFSVMAALQFVRSLNARRDYVAVHGVNLSLSLTHEVSNYACGQTPVCNECERLVGAGIVVVAAAGNRGRRRFLTRKGDEEAYASISITDPGNADAVITVGATHSRDPHTYGVSYFSSRGPTGDGRRKPDLVAPGEKVCSTIPGHREEYLDGTSMAAPHVSGAAALLMCRHRELIGSPLRIKRILCETATDLGREPYFQGAGLLDILRAMQSV